MYSLEDNIKKAHYFSEPFDVLVGVDYTIPCAIMAYATFMKPATFAPLT
jgi:hypothetical protein